MSRFRQGAVPAPMRDALAAADRVLVQGHVRPDGDAVAATLGLGLALEKLGKRVHICLTDGVPERFRFLPGVERVSRDPRAGGPYQVVVLCDTASAVRSGHPHRDDPLAPLTMNIDHHPTNEDHADLNWVDEVSSSTAEMMVRLIRELGVELDPRLGEVLMTGIATDTGFFKYPSTTPETLRIAAALIEAGVDHAALHRRLFEDTPLGVQQLKARALERAEVACGGRLLWSWLAERDGDACGVEGALASLGVAPLCPVQGAEVVACFETRRDGTTIVELRSRGQVSVDRLALEFGGGGHLKASGCTLQAGLEEAKRRVLPRLAELLEGAGDQAAA